MSAPFLETPISGFILMIGAFFIKLGVKSRSELAVELFDFFDAQITRWYDFVSAFFRS